jgi:hypothetical protein
MNERTPFERFMAKVTKTSGCWLYSGPDNGRGYKRFFTVETGNVYAHRFSYEAHHGQPIPAGMMVCHSCDERACVNPAHLWLGDAKSNLVDMASKDRSTHGSRNSQAKLSEGQAAEVFRRYTRGGITMKALGAEFGVSATQVHAVVHRREWARATAALA